MAETLKVTLPSALDAGVDFLKLGEVRFKVTTRVPNELVRINISVSRTTTMRIIGSGVNFFDATGVNNLGLTANLTIGQNTLYIKVNGTFQLSVTDKFALTQLGETMLFSTPSSSTTPSPALYAELDIKELFYTPYTRIRATDVFLGDINGVNKGVTYFDASRTTGSLARLTGVVSSTTFNYTTLNVLAISNQSQVSGSISGINMPVATILKLNGTNVSGEIASGNISNTLREVDLTNCDVKINLTTFPSAGANLTSLILNGSLAYGDIAGLSNYTRELSNLKGLNLSGDIASVNDGVYFLSNVDSVNFENRNSNSSTTFWTTKKPTRTYILALESVRMVTGVDAFLNEMSTLNLHSSSSTGVWLRTINIRGTRTSASDTAVATLAGKGVTVVMSNV